jgi:hypothetical protein
MLNYDPAPSASQVGVALKRTKEDNYQNALLRAYSSQLFFIV